MTCLDALRHADLIVVGSGLYGLTIAERAASAGHHVVVLEKRHHLGGNAWSERDPETDIEVHRYGTHIFHTSNERVWLYVKQFSSFNDYRHHVWTVHDGQVYPMPISLATMSQFYRRHLTPAQGAELLELDRDPQDGPPANLEQKAVQLIGRPLYEAFIRGYTAKQWQTDPKLLPASVIARLPVRMSYETRYFTDCWEGQPHGGYGQLLTNMAHRPNLELYCGVDWFDVREHAPEQTPIVYTGPIDRWFNYAAGHLSWRTLDLELERLPEDDHQGTAVLNYADEHVPQTRVHEFKHLHPERFWEPGRTIIMRETSRWAEQHDEPFYPVNQPEDRKRLLGYRQLAAQTPRVVFGGRLGSYQYLDMHMAIGSALTAWDNQVSPLLD